MFLHCRAILVFIENNSKIDEIILKNYFVNEKMYFKEYFFGIIFLENINNSTQMCRT